MPNTFRSSFIIFVLLLGFISSIVAQVPKEINKDLKRITKNNFDREALAALIRQYPHLLTPHQDVVRRQALAKGFEIKTYPLVDLKKEKWYSKKIKKLVRSNNPYQRTAAALLIAASNDTLFNSDVLSRLKIEEDPSVGMWMTMALLWNKAPASNFIFQSMIRFETIAKPVLLPHFIKLHPDTLHDISRSFLQHPSAKAKVMACEILATLPNMQSEEEIHLKKGLTTWSSAIVGYALNVLSIHKADSLLMYVKSWEDSSHLKSLVWKALAASPSSEDNNYLMLRLENSTTYSESLLDAFYFSGNFKMIRYWLFCLTSEKMPRNYYFVAEEQPLLYTDDFITPISDVLIKIRNTQHTLELMRVLKNRSDDQSLAVMMAMLKYPEAQVRTAAAKVLQGTISLQLKMLLPELIENLNYRTPALTDLILVNEMNQFVPLFESFLNDTSLIWRAAGLKYLSVYPDFKHRELFYSYLKDQGSDSFFRRTAALGLAKLKDKSAVDDIEKALNDEVRADERNCGVYLMALAMLHSDKAKEIITKFTFSKVPAIKQLAEKLIREW